MFNTDLFNGSEINAKNFFANKTRRGISFAGFDLTSLNCGEEKTGLMIQKFNVLDLTNIEITSITSNYEDGGSVLAKKYLPKTITMTVFIQWKDHDDLIQIIDLLKQKTQIIEWNLDIMISGKIRRYTATLSSLIVPPFGRNDDFVENVELEFLITSPHWQHLDTGQTILTNIRSNITRVVQNTGNYKTFPKIFIVGKENCNISSVEIFHKKIWNSGDGYKIVVSENLTNGQVLVLDYKEKIVKIWQREIPFSGIMMPIDAGQANFEFRFTGEIHCNIFVLHDPIFL